MFLITIPSAMKGTISGLAKQFNVEQYSHDALSVEKPSTVGEISRLLCKLGFCFEVQPWE